MALPSLPTDPALVGKGVGGGPWPKEEEEKHNRQGLAEAPSPWPVLTPDKDLGHKGGAWSFLQASAERQAGSPGSTCCLVNMVKKKLAPIIL